MRYADLLNEFIEKRAVSKNTIINNTSIDRSSFFKILNGKRFATEEQHNSILKQLDLTEKEKSELDELYEREKYGEKVWLERELIRNAINTIYKAKESDDYIQLDARYRKTDSIKKKCFSGEEVGEIIKQLVSKEVLSSKKNTISIFAPLGFLQKINFYFYLELLSSSKDCEHIDIRQIIEYPIGQRMINEKNLTIYDSFLKFLLTNRFNYTAGIYYVEECVDDSIGSLLPYYILFSDSVLMLSSSGEKAILAEDKAAIDMLNGLFEEAYTKARPLVSSFDSKEKYVELIGRYPDKKLYIAERNPGVSFMYSEELLNKYIPPELQEWVTSHCKAFIDREYTEYISVDGLKEFASTGKINEAGFQLAGKKEDVERIIELMKTRLHKNLEVLNEDVFPLSMDWAINVIENEFVILVPYLSTSRIIFISEKNIAHAFTDYFENLGNNKGLLNDEELARRFEGYL